VVRHSRKIVETAVAAAKSESYPNGAGDTPATTDSLRREQANGGRGEDWIAVGVEKLDCRLIRQTVAPIVSCAVARWLDTSETALGPAKDRLCSFIALS
jgi:hypothetical protein